MYQGWIIKKENLDRPITSKKIKLVTKNLLTNKKFKTRQWILPNTQRRLLPILLKLFKKTEEKGTLSYSFYEASITPISNTDKKQQKKTTDNILHEVDKKFLANH